jgi:hypothetical protein
LTSRACQALILFVPHLQALPSLCRRCSAEIDRKRVKAELAKHDIPSVAERTAETTVFCSLHCAMENLGTFVTQEA